MYHIFIYSEQYILIMAQYSVYPITQERAPYTVHAEHCEQRVLYNGETVYAFCDHPNSFPWLFINKNDAIVLPFC